MEKLDVTIQEVRSNPLYYHKLNTEKWSNDSAIRVLHDYQRGWYVSLYLAAWRTQGVLDSNEDKLFKLAAADSREQWDADKSDVLAFFTEGVDSNGVTVLVHREMRAQWLVNFGEYEARVENIRKGREKKAAKAGGQETEGKAA